MAIAIQADDSFIGEFPTPATTLEHGDKFESVELREKALEAKSGTYTFRQFLLNFYSKLGEKFYATYEQCIREFGPKKGKEKFNAWLKSETFGIPKNMIGFAKDFSPWFHNLSTSLQNLICQKAPIQNINILKKLIKLPPNLIEELLTGSEKVTSALLNKVLAAIAPPKEKQLKLRKKGYAQVIAPGHQLSGQIGQVQYQCDDFDHVILVMFPGGPEELLKISEVQPVPKPSAQLTHLDKDHDPVFDQINRELDERDQELEKKDQEIKQRDQEIEYYKSLLAENTSKPEVFTVAQDIGSEQELEEKVLDKLKLKLQKEKADEIALIQANVEKEREQAQRREQELQCQLQEKQQEESDLQARRLEAAEAEAKRWQEMFRHLEQKVEQKNSGDQEFALTENAELRKEIKSLLEKNAELEKKAQKEVSSSYLNHFEYEATIETETPEPITAEIAAALELTEELGTTLAEYGIRGWGPDGYHARNNKVYPGPLGIKVFLDEKFAGNNQILEKYRSMETSSAKLPEYSERIATPA